MKLVMTLLVKDEEELIKLHLDYHLSRGVDHVIVTDHASSDATPQIVDEYVRRGLATVIRETTPKYDQPLWVSGMARRAAVELGADWVINADADEFWWPESGDSLKAALHVVGARYGAVRCPTFDFHPLKQLSLRIDQLILRPRQRTTSKVAHRGFADIEVAMGNHNIVSPKVEVLDDIVLSVLHFPARGFAQYERKMTRGGATLSLDPSRSQTDCRHWREGARLSEQGCLREHYNRSIAVGPTRALYRILRRRAVIDLRLRRYLRGVAAEHQR